jgi:hypothetical protein
VGAPVNPLLNIANIKLLFGLGLEQFHRELPMHRNLRSAQSMIRNSPRMSQRPGVGIFPPQLLPIPTTQMANDHRPDFFSISRIIQGMLEGESRHRKPSKDATQLMPSQTSFNIGRWSNRKVWV